MIHMLRQLTMLFVVTLVTMGITVSAGNASMDLKCEMMLTAASVEAPDGHGQHSGAGGSDHVHEQAVLVQDHVHDEDTSSEGHGSHCKAHACPATAFLTSSEVAQAFLLSKTLDAVRTAPLVELTVSEGLRRPPRD
ncbi:hypothetical protein [Paracoccus sp. 228]|uniref:hypothetical protein n=1 Tax=Paracoccus sp. 228 TaxID=1192054 RepID=UPI0005DBBBE3|nr:hypothetical protein [Paracoccus sp. 228]KIX16394.1 hypothetical protein SY26_18545 [Paracoccus sp. 228]ODT64660.1 MAG: hypothetical protein ABS75_34325 [Pelagibacterium sp. SCN 63-23]